MHIHYFQHDHFEDLGYIGDWAGKNNFTTSVTRFDLGMQLPVDHSYDWLVIMGGKMSINDISEFPWLTEEIAFLGEAIQLGKIVIGICLGSQLVAKAAGGNIFRNTEPEMGFWPVNFSEAAGTDNVFRHFTDGLNVLHVHFDTFSLPEGAINMANSAITQCQAFRAGKNVFAFQFHFEVTPQNVAGFIKAVEPELVEGMYAQSSEQMLKLSGSCFENNIVFKKVLDEIFSIRE